MATCTPLEREASMMHVYLFERYVPSMSEEEVVAAAARSARADPTRVRHLFTVLVVGEDTCLSLFEADRPDVVQSANERAGFEVDRIVEASIVQIDGGE